MSESNPQSDSESLMALTLVAAATGALLLLKSGHPSGGGTGGDGTGGGATKITASFGTGCLTPTQPVINISWVQNSVDDSSLAHGGYDLLVDGHDVATYIHSPATYTPPNSDAGKTHSYQLVGNKSGLKSDPVQLTTQDCSGGGGGGGGLSQAQVFAIGVNYS